MTNADLVEPARLDGTPNLSGDWVDEMFGKSIAVLPATVLELKTSQVRSGPFAVRDDSHWKDRSFQMLVRAIKRRGQNDEPIVVRPIKFDPDSYEIVEGHRRHRACEELGLTVRAIVRDDRDIEVVRGMLAHDRHVAKMSPLEKGRLINLAFRTFGWQSDREAEAELGLGYSQIAKLRKLAQLPIEVVKAFPSLSCINTNWGARLAQAVARDERAVVNRATAIERDRGSMSAEDVLEVLDEAAPGGDGPRKRRVRFEVSGELVAEMVVTRGNASREIIVRIEATAFEHERLERGLRQLFVDQLQG